MLLYDSYHYPYGDGHSVNLQGWNRLMSQFYHWIFLSRAHGQATEWDERGTGPCSSSCAGRWHGWWGRRWRSRWGRAPWARCRPRLSRRPWRRTPRCRCPPSSEPARRSRRRPSSRTRGRSPARSSRSRTCAPGTRQRTRQPSPRARRRGLPSRRLRRHARAGRTVTPTGACSCPSPGAGRSPLQWPGDHLRGRTELLLRFLPSRYRN